VKLTIAFTVSCLREKYLRQALDSWAHVRGIQDAHLLFCLEPRPPRSPFPVAEFREFLRRSFRSTEVVVNAEHLGCLRNTRQAMALAFSGEPDFAVLAEEDLVVSTDVLEYFTWAQRYAADPAVQAVCSHVFVSNAQPDQAVRASWFNPLVWGTWPGRWHEYISPGWGGIAGNPDAWDACLRARIREDEKACVFPALSRSQHIGQVSTLTPGALAQHFYSASLSQCFAADYPPQEYRESPRGPALQITV
jgi:GNT-I family